MIHEFSNKAQYVIAISVDALHAADLKQLKSLSNFNQIMEKGSYIKEMVGIYPSLTYPTHVSIMTGTYPDKHGIYANEKNQPGVLMQEWYWHARNIKVPTITELAVKHKKKVGVLFWPVMAGAKIHYNCPEIWPVRDREIQLFLSLRNGTPLFLMDCYLRYGKILKGKEQPNLDDFTTACAGHMIRCKKPHLLLIHLIELDHERHIRGQSSHGISAVLDRQNNRIGQIMDAVKQAGIYKDTAFLIFGDHGFLDFHSRICINTVLVKEGLITLDNKSNVLDWKAYVNSCDGSAQVYLRDPDDTLVSSKVLDILLQLKNAHCDGIEAVYTKTDAALKRTAGDFEFMLEAKKGYAFANEWTGELIQQRDGDYVATHGYDPMKPGYRTMMLAAGAGICQEIIAAANIVDLAPTMASLLGIPFPPVDGRVLKEILV